MKWISQVATSALLIAVAVTAVGIYSDWLPGFARQSVEGITDTQNQKIRCSNAGITLSKVVYNSDEAETTISVKNSGTIDFRENITVSIIDNSSQIVTENYLSELEVDNTRSLSLSTPEKPEFVIAGSYSCPEVTSRRNRIQSE